MSETKTKLTEKQLAWAKAFLRAMGMKPELDVQIVPETQGNKLGGKLGRAQEEVDTFLAKSLKSDKEVRGTGEKVGRGLHGAGTGYKADVVKKIDELLKKADEFVGSGVIGQQVTGLITALEEAKRGYTDRLKGETNKSKLDQRQRKIAAIDKRVHALQGILEDAERERFAKLNYMGDTDRLNELAANPAIFATVFKQGMDKGMATEVIRKLVAENPKALAGEPELFDAFLQLRPTKKQIRDVLSAGDITGADKLVDKIMDRFGDDADMMNGLCMTVVQGEAANQASTGTFFRSNSAATKLTKAFASSGEESKEYLDGVVSLRNGVFDGMPDRVEIDPERLKDEKDEKVKAELIKNSLEYIYSSANTILQGIYSASVPDNIATTAYMIADAATKKSLSQDQVAIMIGGHLLLRLINPMLTNAPKSPGKMMAANEQRLTVLISKVVQNIANHIVAPEKGKEPFMVQTVPFVKKQIPAMSDWCFTVAEKGEEIMLG